MNLDKYQDMLRFQTIITTIENPVLIRLEKQKYINKEFLENVKNYIIQKNQEDFIDEEIKKTIITYLNYFREYSNELGTKELNNIINECIMECNISKIANDVDIYYANELYIRTGGFKSTEWFYHNIKHGDYNNSTVFESLKNDEYYMYCFLNQDIETNIKDGVFNDEMALWSANRFINDIDDIKGNKIFMDNCLALAIYIKKRVGHNLLNLRHQSLKRFKYESKTLYKKIR